MEVKVKSNMDRAMRGLWNVKTKYIQKALVTSLNKVGAEVVTQAKRELKDANDYYCITPENLEGLRVWTLSVQSLLNKYEHATKVLND